MRPATYLLSRLFATLLLPRDNSNNEIFPAAQSDPQFLNESTKQQQRKGSIITVDGFLKIHSFPHCQFVRESY